MSAATPTRRERIRAQTFEEISAQAMAIVDANGVSALTLAAVAKAVGMSAPGLYRYFPTRNALVESVVVAAHEQLADALEHGANQGTRLPAQARLRTVIQTYRNWALDHPKRYALLFGDPSVETRDVEQAMAAANRGMETLIAALVDLQEDTEVSAAATVQLDEQLLEWSRRRAAGHTSPQTLRLAMLTWTQLHGIVSLELSGAFTIMRIDATLILETAIAKILQTDALHTPVP